MGCFYKRFERPRSALRYLRRALEVEREHPDAVENPAGTHLNVCATLSELGQHAGAAEHAAAAVELLQVQLAGAKSAVGEEAVAAVESMLAIAFHNLAVEHEHLGEIAEAAGAYERAVDLGDAVWGREAPMAQALRRNRAAFNKAHGAAKPKAKAKTKRREKLATRRPASAHIEPRRGAPAQNSRRRAARERPWSAGAVPSSRGVVNAVRRSTRRAYSPEVDYGRNSAALPSRGGGDGMARRSTRRVYSPEDEYEALIPEEVDLGDYDDYEFADMESHIDVEIDAVHSSQGRPGWNDDTRSGKAWWQALKSGLTKKLLNTFEARFASCSELNISPSLISCLKCSAGATAAASGRRGARAPRRREPRCHGASEASAGVGAV